MYVRVLCAMCAVHTSKINKLNELTLESRKEVAYWSFYDLLLLMTLCFPIHLAFSLSLLVELMTLWIVSVFIKCWIWWCACVYRKWSRNDNIFPPFFLKRKKKNCTTFPFVSFPWMRYGILISHHVDFFQWQHNMIFI